MNKMGRGFPGGRNRPRDLSLIDDDDDDDELELDEEKKVNIITT